MTRFMGKRWGFREKGTDDSGASGKNRRRRPSRRRPSLNAGTNLHNLHRAGLELRYRSTLFQPLEERIMLDIRGVGSQPPTIVVGRTLSAYDVPDVQNTQETITFTVYNQAADPITGVLLTDTLENGVTFASASQLPDQNGQHLAWSLGTIQPYDRASVTLTVSLASPTPTTLDTGASAYGTLDAGMVSWSTAPATLRTTAIAPALLASTPDANTTDPYVQEKAAELNYDLTQIYNFLQTQIGYNSYVGSLRGARGTLWSSAGNSLDDASLGVALMRASGIPAQYEEGTLTTAQAQQLILSMFPASYQTVGYIPAGTQTSDPANDPQLWSETKDHFWFQFDAGSGMKDADPEFSGQAIGQTATTSTNSFTEVPDGLRAKTEVKLTAELYYPFFAGLIGALNALNGGTGIPGTSDTVVLDRTFNDVDLVGHPLTVGNFVNQSAVQTIFAPTTTTYSPYLEIGDEANPNPNQDQIIRGTDYQEIKSGYPLANQLLTGLFLNVTLSGPGMTAQTYEHTMYDAIGYAARQGLVSQPVSLHNASAASLSPLDQVTLQVSGASQPLPPLQPAAREVGQLSAIDEQAASLVAALGGYGPGDALQQLNIITKRNITATDSLFGTQFLADSDLAISGLAAPLLTSAYFASPRVIAVSSSFESQRTSLKYAVDIIADSPRVEVAPNQNDLMSQMFHFIHGFSDSVIEGTVLGLGGSGRGNGTSSAMSTFLNGLGSSPSVALLTAANASNIERLEIPNDAKARISIALDTGLIVVVPETPSIVDGTITVAWLQVDPTTGDVTAVAEDGTHGASATPGTATAEQRASYALADAQIAVAAEATTELEATEAAQVAGNTGGKLVLQEVRAANAQLEKEELKDVLINELGQYRDYVTRKIIQQDQQIFDILEVQEVALGKYKISKLGQTFLGLFREKFLDNLAGAFALARKDPELPTVTVVPAQSPPSNTASAQYTASTATLLSGSAALMGDRSNVNLQGSVNVSWASASNSALHITAASASEANVLSSVAQSVGTGSVALDASAGLNVTVAGSAQYSITGVGSLGFYGPSESRLGVSGNWNSYSATVTGNVSLTVSVPAGALTLNGQPLPAGAYTITTNSAAFTGSGLTTSPDFAGSASITATSGAVEVGPGTGSLTVSGTTVSTSNGATLTGYSGTISVSANGNGTDAVTLNGNAANVVTVTPSPAMQTTDQSTPVSFNAGFKTSFVDTYVLTAKAPIGWSVTIDNTGKVSVTPAAGTQGGTYPIQIIAQSTTNSDLVSQATVEVTVTQTAPGMTLAVAPDSLLTMPFKGAEIPSAFQATIQNTGPAADTYNLTFSNVPSGFTILNSGTSVTVPAGQTGIVGLYLQPTGTALPPPGTNLSFTVTATSTMNSSITQTVNVSFTMPTIDAVTIASNPASVTSTPGTAANDTITITNVGNVPANAALSATGDNGLTVGGVPGTPVSVGVGKSVTQTITLTPAANAALNSTLTATVNAGPAATQDEVSVVSVNAAPGAGGTSAPQIFAAGQPVEVTADVLTGVLQPRQALASFTLKNSAGATVFTSTPVSMSLPALPVDQTIDLGPLSTTGLAAGAYSMNVSITESGGQAIAGATGTGTLLIDSPIAAGLSVDAEQVSPGANTVTSTLTVANQTALGSVATDTAAGSVAINGTLAYVAGGKDISVVDLSNPASPKVLGTFASGKLSSTGTNFVEVAGSNLIVATLDPANAKSIDVLVYSLANATSPQLTGSVTVPSSYLGGLAVAGNTAYLTTHGLNYDASSGSISDQFGNIVAVDFSNPAAPILAGTLFNDPAAPDGHANYLSNVTPVNGQLAYAATSTSTGPNTQTGQGQLLIVNTSDPTHLSVTGALNLPGTVQALAVAIQGNTALVVGSSGGFLSPFGDASNIQFTGNVTLTLLDISNPANPKIVGSTVVTPETLASAGQSPVGKFDAVSLGGNRFAVNGTLLNGQPVVLAVDASTPTNLALSTYAVAVSIAELAVSGDTLVTAGANGLQTLLASALADESVTAEVDVPNAGATLDQNSFSTPPSQIVPGANTTALIWKLSLAPGESQQITWTSTVNNLQPGQVQQVATGGSVQFVAGGQNQSVTLPPLSVVAVETPQSVQIPLLVRSAQTVAISQSSVDAGSAGNSQLAGTLSELSDTISQLQAAPTDTNLLSRSQLLLSNLGTELASDPVLASSAPQLTPIQTDAKNGDVTAMLTAIPPFFTSIDKLLAVETAEQFTVAVSPNEVDLPALANQQKTLTVTVTDTGPDPVTLNLSTGSLPNGVTATLGQTQLTLQPGASQNVSLTLTSNLVSTHIFTLNVLAADSTDSALATVVHNGTAIVAVRAAAADVLSVTVNPISVTTAGTPIAVSASIFNTANATRNVQAQLTVLDSSNKPVGTPTDVPITLTPMANAVTFPLGNLDTTGLANGVYSLEVSLLASDGTALPGKTSEAPFLIGIPISASVSASPTSLPPGTSSVTTTITVENQGSVAGGQGSTTNTTTQGSTVNPQSLVPSPQPLLTNPQPLVPSPQPLISSAQPLAPNPQPIAPPAPPTPPAFNPPAGDAVKWIGTSDGNWDVAGNWLDTTTNTNHVPDATDNVTIDASGLTVTVEAGNQAAQSLLVKSGSTLKVAGGNLTLSAGAEVDGTLDLVSNTLTVGGGATLKGNVQWPGGTLNLDGGNVFNLGTITLSNNLGIVSNNNAGTTNLKGTFFNEGTVVEQSGGLWLYDSVELDNTSLGTWQLASDVGINFGTYSPSIVNSGLLQKTGGTGNSDINTAMTNTGGTLEADTGTLRATAANDSFSGGVFNAQSGATVWLNANTSGMTFSGTFTGSGAGTVLLAGGSIGLAGDTTFNFPTGLFQWSNSTINLAGHTLTNAGGISLGLATQGTSEAIASTDASNKPLVGALENDGTFNLQGPSTFYLDDKVVLDNSATGNLFFAASANGAPGLFVGNGTPSFTNEGTIEKTSGTGTSQIAVAFTYTGGSIKVDSGTLTLDPPSAQVSGTSFTVAAGATLDLAGNSSGNVFSGTFTGTGGGTVLLESGSIVVGSGGATFDFPSGMFQWTGGYINLDGHTLTNTGSMTLANANNVSLSANDFFTGDNKPNLGGTFNNTGAIVQQAAGSLGLYDSVAFNNEASGTYTLASDGGLYYGNFSVLLTNAGLIDKSAGSGTSVIGVELNNSGTLEVDSGMLSLQGNGGSSTAGVFNVATGATLVLSGNGTNGNVYSGTYTGSGGGTVTIGNGSIVIGAAGATFNFPTGMFQWTAGGINLDGNTLTNAGSMTVANTGNVSLYGNGDYAGGSQKGGNQGGTLDNQGTFTDQGPATIFLDDSVLLKNEPSATINLAGGASLAYQNYSSAVSNAGTLQVNGSTATIATPLANSGTIVVTGGGTLSFNQSSSLNNTGTVEANGGVITLSGTIKQVVNGILTGGTWIATAGGTMILPANSNITVTDARLVVSGAGSTIGGIGLLARNDGAVTVTSGATFTTAGNFTNNGSLTLGGGPAAGALRPAESTALGFNGSSDFVSVGSLGARPTQGTISFWIKPTTVSNYQNVLTTGPTNSDGTGGNQAIRFEENGQSLYALFGSDTASDNGSSGTSAFLLTNSLTPGAWVNVAVTWDSSTNQVTGYVNGSQVFSSTNTNWPSNFGNVTFGSGYASNPAYNRYYNGLLSDVRFYNTDRSQPDIQGDMSSLLTGSESGLIGYWPLSDGSGTTAADLTANHRNGTLGGGTAADEPAWVPIAPADTFVVPGSFTETSNASLDFQLGGTPASGQFGQLVVTGTAAFAGMLRSEFTSGYAPAAGDDFAVATYADTTGSFSAIDLAESPTVAYSANVGTTSLMLISQAATLTPTQTTVSSSAPSGASYGQLVEYTATVTAASGTPTGSVQFQIDGLNQGAPIALSGGQATLTISLPVGTHSIAAFYLSGSSPFAGSDDSANPLTQVVSPATVTPSSIELYYTTFGGPSSIDKVAVSLSQGNLTLGTPTPIVQNLPADGLIFLPNGDLLTANGPASEVNPNTGAVTTQNQVAGEHLALDPSGKYVWTSPQPGPLYKLPIDPLGPATQETLTGDDIYITHIAFDNSGQAFYVSSNPGGNGSFGLIDLTTFTTKRVYSNLPAAHGISYDPFTGDLFLVGASSVAQIDPNTLKIVSELDFPGGFTFDQGANDGKGHLFAADNNGHLLVVDYSATGLVGDPRDFVATPFLANALDDVAPLSGLGGAGIPVTISHQLPAAGYNVNPTSIAPNPSSFSSTGVTWNTTFAPGQPETDQFQLTGQATNMAPGEVRQISDGTTVTATVTASDGSKIPVSIPLPPLTVAAQHIIELTPPTATANQGSTATYTVELSNPLPTDATYTLAVDGLPAGEAASLQSSVTVPAGKTQDVPLTIAVRLGATLGTEAFLVSAQTAAGASDSVEGQLTVTANAQIEALAVNLTLTPQRAVAGQTNPAVYTLTLTNTGDTTDTYNLSDALPAGFTGTFSQTSVTVPPGIGNFRDVRLALTPPVGAAAQDDAFTVTATSTTDGTVSSQASGTVGVLAQGVQVQLTPSSAVPGSTYQLKVTNTGQAADTFNLSLASPGALVSTLGTNQVTLQPGASQTVPVTTKAVNFADPGALPLTGVATSQTNGAVQDQSTADLTIASTQSMTAAFTPAQQTLVLPGNTSFLLEVNNTGNSEDSYSATIVGTTGPITANLVGLDGQPAQSVPLFILPGLSTGALLLQVQDTGAGQGTVTVLVQSLTSSDIKAASTATITVGSTTPSSATLMLRNNVGLAVAEGASVAVNAALLTAADSDSAVTPANIVYTLTSVPTQGTLLLAGQALAAGGTFTQDDINQGRLTYKATEEGADAFTFTVAANAAATISGTFLIAVSDPGVVATGGYTLSAIEGAAMPVQTMATFTDTGGFEPQASFTAQIEWGDGTSSAGTVVLPGSGNIAAVTGQHTYAEEGSYTVHVTLHHEGAPDATISSTAVVSDPQVAASGGFTYSATAGGAATSQTVAVFTDPGGAEAVGDYTASIDWGDGTTGPAAVSLDATTHLFTVTGQHPYAASGSYPIQVSVHHDTAGSVTVAGTAVIAKAATSGGPGIAATAVAVTGYERTALTGATVATFSDGDGSLPAADFTATIAWGDGTSSSGTVSPGGGNYTVTGSHTYLDEGHYAVQVSIGPAAGDAAAVGSAATVSANATIHEELLAEGGVGTPNQNYIQEIYRDLFGRAAEPQGRDYWVSKLAAGQTRLQVTTAMVQLAFPREFQRDTVETLYQQYLGRAPDPAGNAFWTAFLYGGGTAEQMSQAIINSPEFWKLSGATDSGFLDALFRDALGRAIDPSALTYFQGQMAHGATPYQVAAMIFASDEYDHVRADAFIEQFLDRPADPATADPIAAQLAQGQTDEQVIAQLLASDEYFAKTQI